MVQIVLHWSDVDVVFCPVVTAGVRVFNNYQPTVAHIIVSLEEVGHMISVSLFHVT